MKIELPKKPLILSISKLAQSEIRVIADQMYSEYLDVHNHLFRRMLLIHAAKLPNELLAELVVYKEAFGYEDYGAIVFKGLWDVNQQLMGTTPARWQDVKNVAPEVQKELMIMQFAFALIHGAIGSTGNNQGRC